MTRFEPGDVVLVRFPFTNLSAVKKRPALVVSPGDFTDRHGDVVIVALTSQPQPTEEDSLQGWMTAGLLKETWLKPLIGTVAAGVVERRLGSLSPYDRSRVAATLRRLIASMFRG
ncbi:MAG: type II toxin-antitoxin system PemK/MazF family toxin [Phycisphaerales bacterium]|nr:type II toxin-antitoxin system PemK/MazF family toxin [Phycisphaerales bacterium]